MKEFEESYFLKNFQTIEVKIISVRKIIFYKHLLIKVSFKEDKDKIVYL